MKPSDAKKKADVRAHLFWKLYRGWLDDHQRDDIDFYDAIIDAFASGYMHGAGFETLKDLKNDLQELKDELEQEDD
jgi:hypothetical protein